MVVVGRRSVLISASTQLSGELMSTKLEQLYQRTGFRYSHRLRMGPPTSGIISDIVRCQDEIEGPSK